MVQELEQREVKHHQSTAQPNRDADDDHHSRHQSRDAVEHEAI